MTARKVLALLRKDRLWLGFAGAAGVTLSYVFYVLTGFAQLWISLDPRILGPEAALVWLLASIFGLVWALREDLTRTREYLAHRPVTFATVFATRQLGALLVLCAWVMVPILGYYLYSRATADDAEVALMEPERLTQLLIVATVAFPCYAAAYFAGTVSRRWLHVLLLGAPALILTCFVYVAPNPALVRERSFVDVVANLVVAALLIAAAGQHEREGFDPDRPQAGHRTWLGRTAAVVGLLGSGVLLSAFLQIRGSEALHMSYPSVLRLPGRGYTLAIPPPRGRDWIEVDANHKRTGRHLSPDPVWSLSYTRAEELPRGLRFAFSGQRWAPLYSYHSDNGPSAAAFLNLDEGTVEIREGLAASRGRAVRRHIGKLPEGSRFSERTRPLSFDGHQIVLLDPSDGLWRYDIESEAQGFAPMLLPGGDNVVEEVSALVSRAARTVPGLSLGFRARVEAVRGTRGVYLFDGQVWKPLSDVVKRAIDALPKSPNGRIEIADPIDFVVSIREGDAEVLRHRFQPRTAAERTYATLIHLGSLLRPPLLQIASAASRQPPKTRVTAVHVERPRDWPDQLVIGGKRPLFLIVQLALAAALATLVHVRLRRLGATPSRRWIWATVVATGGAFAFAAYRLCETDRAWKGVSETPAAPPLITGAARPAHAQLT